MGIPLPDLDLFSENMTIHHGKLHISTSSVYMTDMFRRLNDDLLDAVYNKTAAPHKTLSDMQLELNQMFRLIDSIMHNEIATFWECVPLTTRNEFHRRKTLLASSDIWILEPCAGNTLHKCCQIELNPLTASSGDTRQCVSIDIQMPTRMTRIPVFRNFNNPIPSVTTVKSASSQKPGCIYSTRSGNQYLYLGQWSDINNKMAYDSQVPIHTYYQLDATVQNMLENIGSRATIADFVKKFTALYPLPEYDSIGRVIKQPDYNPYYQSRTQLELPLEVSRALLAPSALPARIDSDHCILDEHPAYYLAHQPGTRRWFITRQDMWDTYHRMIAIPQSDEKLFQKLFPSMMPNLHILRSAGIWHTPNNDKMSNQQIVDHIIKTLQRNDIQCTYNQALSEALPMPSGKDMDTLILLEAMRNMQ